MVKVRTAFGWRCITGLGATPDFHHGLLGACRVVNRRTILRGVTTSCREILAQAECRWTALSDAHPSLAPAVELQRQLVGESIGLFDRLQELPEIIAAQDPAALAEKLKRGLPALRGEPVEVPVAILAPSLDRFCRYLADAGAGDVARHLVETLESGRMSRGSLLSASLTRNQRAIRMGATQMGLAPDLVWLVGELATAPLAQLLQDRLFTTQEGMDRSAPLPSALATWDRGYCPACGSWPALAEYIGVARYLRCSYCGARWPLQSRRCIYCDETGAAFRTITPDMGSPHHVLELCDQCGGYTKATRVAASIPFPLLPIEDLETFGLDRTAAHRGYGRPPLLELGGEATCEPPSEP